MKLNPNCVRDILLELEKLPYQHSCKIDTLSNALPTYDKDELSYTCLKLSEANYINISTVNAIGMPGPAIHSINDITFYGHEFLNNIRSDSVWNNVKAVGSKVGASSISAFSQIATGVVTALIQHQLGI